MTTLLYQLVELGKKDTAIDMLKKEAENIPAEISAVKAEFAEIEKAAKSEIEEMKKGILKIHELEGELKAQTALIEKHQVELNQVKTNEAFKALENEIKSAKEKADALETEILVLMDKTQENAAKEKEISAKINAAKNGFSEKEKQLAAGRADLDGRIKKLTEERDKFCETVEQSAMEKYNYLRGKRGNAVSAVKQTSNGLACGACNMLFTPSVSAQIDKGDKLIFCDNCQRIIFKS